MEELGRGKRIKHTANREYPNRGQSSQKKRPASSTTEGYSHPWFSSKSQEEIFNESFASKEIIPPKVLSPTWIGNQGFHFQSHLLCQGLGLFICMKGTYYPDLVRVFYSNLKKNDDCILVSEVKGIEIRLTDDVFLTVCGLQRSGIVPTFENLREEGFDIKKEVFFVSMLRDVSAWEADLEAKRKGKKKITYNTGGLFVEDRLLHYVICWIIAARGSNHAQISEDDLVMMAAIKNSIKVDWVHVVEDIMLKTRRLVEYKYPYALFVSRVLERFEVPVDGEAREFTREIHEVNERVLKMMKLVKTNTGWISREEVQHMGDAGTAEPHAEQPVEDDDPFAEQPQTAEETAEEEKPLSAFERAVLAKLDDIRECQRRDYQELKDHLETISERLDAMNIPHPDDL